MGDFDSGQRSRVIPLAYSTGDLGTLADVNERVLKSAAVPANTLNKNGKMLRGRAWGFTAANANGKTVRLRLGTVTLVGTALFTQGPLGMNNRSWELHFEIIRTAEDVQYCHAQWVCGGAPAAECFSCQRTPGALDDAAALLLEVTGQNAVAAANDIVGSGLTVEVVDAP